ncbi:uncharacterized protein [Setaria viridis]|uniref:uncharacterized protein n=1 Tax=Setaria viridis TaxID=4556 RepID=UPI0014933786|nr:uncharacterized protein LOC117834389 [Setaria viridis]
MAQQSADVDRCGVPRSVVVLLGDINRHHLIGNTVSDTKVEQHGLGDVHVLVTLDFDDSNYVQWSAFLDNTLLKFRLIDHVDGTVDTQLCLHNAKWTQIDHYIVSWLYATVTKGIMDTIFQPRCTAFSLWMAIHNLLLDNAMHHALYALQEFHSLFQGDMFVNEYCGRLRKLSDELHDVGDLVSDPALVVNMLRGLNSKFHNVIFIIGSQCLMPDFLIFRSYLLPEERHMENRHKMEDATALLAIGSSSSSSKHWWKTRI